MADGVEVAKAFVTIVPTVQGAQKTVNSAMLPAAESAGKKSGAAIGSGITDGVKKAAKVAAGAIAAIGVGKAVKSSIDAFTGLAASTKSLQRIMGGTAEEVSGMSGAMRLSGMDTSKANTSLTILSKKLSALQGDADATAKASKALGTSIFAADGSMRSMSDILPEIADRFAEMPDGAQKTALAVQYFGRSGAAMLPFLNKGSAGIAELTAKAKELGIVLDDSAMDDFGNYRVAVRELSVAFDGLKVSAGSTIAPIATEVVNGMSSVVVPALGATLRAFLDFGEGLKESIDFEGLHEAFAGVSDALGTAFGDGNKAQTFGATVGAAINGLIPVIQASTPIISGIADAFKWLSDNASTVVPVLVSVAGALVLVKASSAVVGMVQGISGALVGIASRGVAAGAGLAATAAGEAAAGSASTAAAPEILAAAAAVIALGAGIMLASAGIYMLASGAVMLAESGIGAVGTFALMAAAIAGLAIVFAAIGPALTAASVGMLAFGAAILLVGAGASLAGLGLVLMASAVPTIAKYALTAGVGLAAISAALILFTVSGLVAVAGMVALTVTLGIFSAAMLLASVGSGRVAKSMVAIAKSTLAMRSGLRDVPAMCKAVKSEFKGLSNAIEGEMDDSVDAVKDGVSDMVNAWSGAEFKKPKIPLPHFKVDGKLNMNGKGGSVTVPKVSVEWYKTGAIATDASIVGIGERGNEAIVPLSGSYMQPFARAIAENMGGGNTINIQLNYSADADANQMVLDIANGLRRLNMIGGA